MTTGCHTCTESGRRDLAVRERILVTAHWRLAHAFGTSLPGWLVLMPLRHLTALDQLDHAEAAELGPLLVSATAALREVTGCEKTYVALFAEAEGFAHLHFHVVPRPVDLAPELRGPRVFALLGAAAADEVDEDTRDRIAERLSNAMSTPCR
jgi:diadenosine tetraphosphate (Ap4A) HIT family hydrolase